MEEILVPIFVCVVLPVSIVLIISFTKMNGENKRAKIVIKAIEANKDVDTNQLIESLKKPRKTANEILNAYLLRGCITLLLGIVFMSFGIYVRSTCHDTSYYCYLIGGILLAIGIGYLIVFFVARKQTKKSDSK